MNARTISIGLVSGALAASALNIPLHHIQPAAYIPGWETIPGYLGWAGYVCAGLLVVLAGYIAARVSWVAKPLQVGALTGALAGLIAFLLSGASAAGLSGSAPILLAGNQSLADTMQAIFLFAEAITRISWYTYLTLAALIAGGALLGMLGAGLHIVQGSGNWLAEPQPLNGSVRFLFTLTSFLISGMSYLLLEVLLTATPQFEAVDELELMLWDLVNLSADGVRLWPKALTLVVMLFALWHSVCWITRWLQHPANHVRQSARLIAALAAVFSLTMYFFLFRALSNLERFPLTMLLLAVGITAAAVTRSQKEPSPPDSEPLVTPRDWFQGLFLAPLLAAQVLVGGGVLVWQALQSNVLPFLPGLMGNTETPPVDLIANTQAYFSTHTELVVRGVLYAILVWALAVWPIGWLFSRATEKRFYPYDEGEEE